jgi:hypothetical protein
VESDLENILRCFSLSRPPPAFSIKPTFFSGQLTEMKSSGEQTAQLIDNNAALAASATKQAEAADKQANAMNAAVEVSRESLIAAGRAWVGLSFGLQY